MAVSTVAITGASGYVGGSLCAAFERAGWRVRALSPGTEVPVENRFVLTEPVRPGMLEGVDCLVHAAYDMRVFRWKDIVRANVNGSKAILDAARQTAVPRVLVISTPSAFDGAVSLYGKAKLEIERAAFAIGAAVVRPGLVYGLRPGGMVGRLMKQTKGLITPVVGKGDIKLYLCHEDDLAAMLIRLAGPEQPAPSEPLSAASSQPFTFQEILGAFARVQGRSPRYVHVPPGLILWALRLKEALGIAGGFRSDSLVSLLNQNPHPDFSAAERLGFTFRPFDPSLMGGK
jgi:nucleoside-diphosphate-sugar epimerase